MKDNINTILNVFKHIITPFLNRMNICNINFMSQFCFINNEQIHVQTYITQNNKQKITCQKGHELILVNGNKNIAHFRHKNSEDVGGFPMTEWHTEWQGNFPITEISYPKINDTQITTRRADAILEEQNLIIEFQNSKIEEIEVNNRKYLYYIIILF